MHFCWLLPFSVTSRALRLEAWLILMIFIVSTRTKEPATSAATLPRNAALDRCMEGDDFSYCTYCTGRHIHKIESRSSSKKGWG